MGADIKEFLMKNNLILFCQAVWYWGTKRNINNFAWWRYLRQTAHGTDTRWTTWWSNIDRRWWKLRRNFGNSARSVHAPRSGLQLPALAHNKSETHWSGNDTKFWGNFHESTYLCLATKGKYRPFSVAGIYISRNAWEGVILTPVLASIGEYLRVDPRTWIPD